MNGTLYSVPNIFPWNSCLLNSQNWRWMHFWFTRTSLSKSPRNNMQCWFVNWRQKHPLFGILSRSTGHIPCNATSLWGECTLQSCGWTPVPIYILSLKVLVGVVCNLSHWRWMHSWVRWTYTRGQCPCFRQRSYIITGTRTSRGPTSCFWPFWLLAVWPTHVSVMHQFVGNTKTRRQTVVF